MDKSKCEKGQYAVGKYCIRKAKCEEDTDCHQEPDKYIQRSYLA